MKNIIFRLMVPSITSLSCLFLAGCDGSEVISTATESIYEMAPNQFKTPRETGIEMANFFLDCIHDNDVDALCSKFSNTVTKDTDIRTPASGLIHMLHNDIKTTGKSNGFYYNRLIKNGTVVEEVLVGEIADLETCNGTKYLIRIFFCDKAEDDQDILGIHYILAIADNGIRTEVGIMP